MGISDEELQKIKEKFELTPEQFEEMYNKCKHITFYNCEPQGNPTAIFVA